MTSQLAALFQALADESRLRTLAALRHGELCVCQIVELLRLAPATVSRHLAVLRNARLIETRKLGRWIHCRLPGPHAPAAVRAALRLVFESLGPAERADAERLAAICRVAPEKLAARQRACGGCCLPFRVRTRRRPVPERTHS
jgi:ArsR family transcriptional regulator